MQAKLIDLTLLSADEIAWIDDYHSQVWEKVSIRPDSIIICLHNFFPLLIYYSLLINIVLLGSCFMAL